MHTHLHINKSADLEKVWRSLIPVESFTDDPADPTPTTKRPEVGIRWGKPADFEFDLGEDENQKKDGSKLVIRNAPIEYETVEIIGSDEVFRKFKLGKIKENNDEFEAEDTLEWLFDGNTSHSFPTKDIWQIPYDRQVNVYFRFEVPDNGQVLYVEGEFTREERGEYPEGTTWTGVEILKEG